jgi:hypothetical protein
VVRRISSNIFDAELAIGYSVSQQRKQCLFCLSCCADRVIRLDNQSSFLKFSFCSLQTIKFAILPCFRHFSMIELGL